MVKRPRLSKTMTVARFDSGYWYATELKVFAKALGIPSPWQLRKDQLERAIKVVLRNGTARSPTRRRTSSRTVRDVERGLHAGLPVVAYTSNRETKEFLEREARKRFPGHRRRSGARYRLNRWREAQLRKGIRITYLDLVREYARLCRAEAAFTRISTGRYINFLSDFLASEPGATHAGAIRAWKQLKRLPIPKDYGSWKRSRRSRAAIR